MGYRDDLKELEAGEEHSPTVYKRMPEKPPQPERDVLFGYRDKRHEVRRVYDPHSGKMVSVLPDPVLEPTHL
jgi:hypothetical protein